MHHEHEVCTEGRPLSRRAKRVNRRGYAAPIARRRRRGRPDRSDSDRGTRRQPQGAAADPGATQGRSRRALSAGVAREPRERQRRRQGRAQPARPRALPEPGTRTCGASGGNGGGAAEHRTGPKGDSEPRAPDGRAAAASRSRAAAKKAEGQAKRRAGDLREPATQGQRAHSFMLPSGARERDAPYEGSDSDRLTGAALTALHYRKA